MTAAEYREASQKIESEKNARHKIEWTENMKLKLDERLKANMAALPYRCDDPMIPGLAEYLRAVGFEVRSESASDGSNLLHIS